MVTCAGNFRTISRSRAQDPAQILIAKCDQATRRIVIEDTVISGTQRASHRLVCNSCEMLLKMAHHQAVCQRRYSAKKNCMHDDQDSVERSLTLAHQLCTHCSNKSAQKVELKHRTCICRHTLKGLNTVVIHALSLGASRTGTALRYFVGGEVATTATRCFLGLFCRQQIGWSPAGSKFIPQRLLTTLEISDSESHKAFKPSEFMQQRLLLLRCIKLRFHCK